MSVPSLPGLSEIAHRYRLIVCDLWGVVHNGRHAFPDALVSLAGLSAAGAVIHLVSNAPRPRSTISVQLNNLGVEKRYYDDLVTSGDTTRAALLGSAPFNSEGAIGPGLIQYSGTKCLHIGPDRDLPLFDGLDCRLITGLHDKQIACADFIVCTGLFDDETETAEDYRPWLEQAVARDLLMVCANPDLVVMRGSDKIPCAGAVAASYESLGGKVKYFGKPHVEVYQSCLDLWRNAAHAAGVDDTLDPEQVLVIGDSLHTDIPGALKMGFRSVLISGGIHAEEFGVEPDELPSPKAIDRACEKFGVTPDYVMASLMW